MPGEMEGEQNHNFLVPESVCNHGYTGDLDPTAGCWRHDSRVNRARGAIDA